MSSPRVILRWFYIIGEPGLRVRAEGLNPQRTSELRAIHTLAKNAGWRRVGSGVFVWRALDPDAPLALIRAFIAAGYETCGLSQGEVIVYDGSEP